MLLSSRCAPWQECERYYALMQLCCHMILHVRGIWQLQLLLSRVVMYPAFEYGLGAKQAQLLDSLFGTERGLSASSEVRAEINELITQLEAKNPNPSLPEVRISIS